VTAKELHLEPDDARRLHRAGLFAGARRAAGGGHRGDVTIAALARYHR
jgi:hypothetical protein